MPPGAHPLFLHSLILQSGNEVVTEVVAEWYQVCLQKDSYKNILPNCAFQRITGTLL